MADKERLNLIVCGHVDHGKSTGIGHMLFLLGQIHDPKKKRPAWRIAEAYYKQSRELQMGSWAYAWILDPLIEERERGLTINIAFMEFQTNKYIYNLIDAPGHSDFVKNLITGASQADAAILMSSARPGEFEDGFKSTGSAGGKYADVIGMTLEHMLLLTSLGITDIVVAINKMDTVDWDKKRYETMSGQIKKTFGTLMKAIRTENVEEKLEQIQFVPTSGLYGVNMLTKDMTLKNLEGHINAAKTGKADAGFIESLEKEKAEIERQWPDWYEGPSLIEALDNLPSPGARKADLMKKSLRVPIQSVLSIPGAGTVLTGRIASGVLKPETTVNVSPTKRSLGLTPITVKTIQEFHKDLPQAAPGDNVGIAIKAKNIGPKDIIRGSVLSDGDATKAVESLRPGVDGFLSLVLVIRSLGKVVKKGAGKAWSIHVDYSPVVHLGTAQTAARVTEIKNLKGEDMSELTQNQQGMVWMTPLQPMVVEPLTQTPALGRFALRDSGKTVAVGIVEKVEKDRYKKE
ncbi:MAG: GTP-binding protein [Candidatus Hodarchaeota archaeon]